MDADEVFLQLSAAIRALAESVERTQGRQAALDEQLQVLLTLMEARSDLAPGHRRLLEKLGERRPTPPVPIELSPIPDKYAVENSAVDCDARMHLCHGRCCTFKPALSRQDLKEGQLEWNIDRPYLLAKNAEGYCVYQTRETGFCGTYDNRPAGCRTYTCEGDQRIWIDFDKRIPQPMPDNLITIRRTVPAPTAK